VAVGTSLPELATTIVAAVRREADIALGNVVGSNVFNLLAVAGPVALIRPVAPDSGVGGSQLLTMLAMTLLLPLCVRGRTTVGRGAGLLLLLAYTGAVIWWTRGGA
jgi:cation:H+ antiporter